LSRVGNEKGRGERLSRVSGKKRFPSGTIALSCLSIAAILSNSGENAWIGRKRGRKDEGARVVHKIEELI